MTDKELIRMANFELTSNQVARVEGDYVKVDIFRGSNLRRNRTKMATLHFEKRDVLQALVRDTFYDLVQAEVSRLSLRLVPDEFGWQ